MLDPSIVDFGKYKIKDEIGSLPLIGERSSANGDDKRELTRCLWVITFLSLLCNYDHGAIPAIIGQIKSMHHLGYFQQSLLGSLVYLGLMVGTLMSGFALKSFAAKKLLIFATSACCLSLYAFGAAESLSAMYLARFLGGFFQALPVVYLPVWVDAKAPVGKESRWMSIVQLAGIFGAVLGYFMAGIVCHERGSEYLSVKLSWRTPFFLQAILLVPAAILLLTLTPDTINIPAHPQIIRGRPTNAGDFYSGFWYGIESTIQECTEILKIPSYVLITLGMSNLFFVLTGVQFWVTEYMVVVLQKPRLIVVYISTFSFLTGPTTGIAFGGYACDSAGGYRGAGQKLIVNYAAIFAGLAAANALLASQASNIFLFAAALWGCLFFGATLVPLSIGLILSCVPSYKRSLASALSQLSYNVFGWFSAPLLSGLLMDVIAYYSISVDTPLRLGFTSILLTSFVGFFLFLAANLTQLPSSEDDYVVAPAEQELCLQVTD